MTIPVCVNRLEARNALTVGVCNIEVLYDCRPAVKTVSFSSVWFVEV